MKKEQSKNKNIKKPKAKTVRGIIKAAMGITWDEVREEDREMYRIILGKEY
jgi:hypothetical protein